MKNNWKVRIMAILTAGTLCLGGCSAAQNAASDSAESVPQTDAAAAASYTAAVDYTAAEVSSAGPEVSYTERELTGSYDDEVTTLTLNGESVTITEAGTWVLSGSIKDGQIIVDAGDGDKVQLVLDGVDVSCSDGPAILVLNADKVFLTLAEGSVNTLSDGAERTADAEKYDACVYSGDDLCINGTGSLTVTGNYEHGICSNDDLVITDGVLAVTAAADGLKGKDSVEICGGSIEIDAGGDGIQSSNDEDADRGYVSVDGGSIVIRAEDEGIQSVTALRITAGGLDIDAAGDALHTDGDLTVSGGSVRIVSGDDGIHADGALTVSDGVIEIAESHEGMEGHVITVSGGEISIRADDDGINAANGGAQSGSRNMMGGDSGAVIRITGGTVYVNADGDGVDSNGTISIEGGALYVDGPTDNGNGAIDAEYGCTVTGGTVIAVGSSGMAQGMGRGSTQGSILCDFNARIDAGTVVSVKDAAGNTILEFTAAKSFSSVLVSDPALELGETCTVTAGDRSVEMTVESLTSGTSGMMGGFGGQSGGRPGLSDGETPEFPNGQAPDFSNGEMPDFSDGQMPEFPDGETPDFSGGFGGQFGGGMGHGGFGGQNNSQNGGQNDGQNGSFQPGTLQGGKFA